MDEGKMTRASTKPRFDYLDADWGWKLLAYFERQIAEYLAKSAQETLSQLDYAMFGDSCADYGCLRYGLGLPLADVLEAFAVAAPAYLKVFELRGTQPAFAVNEVDLGLVGENDASMHPQVVRRKPLHEIGAMDESLANPHRGLQALCIASLVHDRAGVLRLAQLMGELRDATPPTSGSWVTPNEHCVAYAFRALVVNDREQALRILRGLRPSDDLAAYQGLLLQTLADFNKGRALSALDLLLNEHRQEAQLKNNYKDPSYYICTFGIAAFALFKNYFEFAELPQNDPYFPVTLLK